MLTIHRAERADGLVQALAELLVGGGPLAATAAEADPFAPHLVAVPTRGIERWLSQQLAGHLGARPGIGDGICANVEFPSPAALVADALALASGIPPEGDPWRPERLVWPLIGVVEDAMQEAWLAPLAHHFADGAHQHRYARLARIARLFADYAYYRPELVQAWARGEWGGVDPEHQAAWQPELWRRLREAVGVASVAERLESACGVLVERPQTVALPDQLAVFGLTRMPGTHLQVLKALAVARDVHLMLLHPSPVMWERGEPENRLLASWGRDVKGLQSLLLSLGADADVHHPGPVASVGVVSSLLEAIQADVRADRPAPGPPLREGAPDTRFALAAGDRSVAVHACHGRARQVEVLREAILHRLARDPSLEPRDIIVMCPDIEGFASLIEATFGGGEIAGGALGQDGNGDGDGGGIVGDVRAAGEPGGRGPVLRVRLADRSLRRTTPILALVTRLLELAGARLTASQVLDLADTVPVRARFRFDDDELARARQWVAEAGIHWGLDGAHREPYKLAEVDAGTWTAGLKRLLLGVALTPGADTLTDGVLPVAEIQSSEVELLGRLCELVDRLNVTVTELSGAHTLAGWSRALTGAADRLALTRPGDAWERTQLDEILAETVAAGGGSSVELTLAEVRALLAGRLEGRPTRANFRSGHLTFCTLVPMRSVPHRVICLLGLDDGAFPRQPPRDGDNLLLADPHPGDRDPRTEDRQLLLDALLAAREALIITYSGHDERTNAGLPPAVPVGELLDTIDATARPADGRAGRARDHVVIHHPLQAFDPRNFVACDSEVARAWGGPWSFDAAAQAGAHALTQPRRPAPPFLPQPLEPSGSATLLTLEELVSFLQRPVRAFLRQRLGLLVGRDEDVVQDALPITLDGLARWSVGQRLLEARLSGVPARDAGLAEIARGSLPPGQLAQPVMEQLWPDLEALVAVAATHRAGHTPATLATNLTFVDGVRLTGSVAEVHGHVLVSVSYSRLHPRQRLASWARLLALSAAHPEIPFECVTIGRGGDGGVSVARVPQLGQTAETRRETAITELGALIALRARGLCSPLPIPCGSAHAYAVAARRSGDDPIAAANRVWLSRYGFSGEDAEPEHKLALGESFDMDLMRQLAIDLWSPLLVREVID